MPLIICRVTLPDSITYTPPSWSLWPVSTDSGTVGICPDVMPLREDLTRARRSRPSTVAARPPASSVRKSVGGQWACVGPTEETFYVDAAARCDVTEQSPFSLTYRPPQVGQRCVKPNAYQLDESSRTLRVGRPVGLQLYE